MLPDEVLDNFSLRVELPVAPRIDGAAAGLLFLFGFGILRIVTLTDGTYLNAPATIAFFTVFASAIWVLIGGGIAGEAATRDRQTRMHALLYTTPVSKFNYLGGRLLAALVLNALLMLALNAGFLVSVYGPGAKTSLIGPFHLASYLTSYGYLALPTIVATTVIQFGLAALSGRATASYVAGIGILLFLSSAARRYASPWIGRRSAA
ncbi:ABC transporter permease [Spirosoma sp. KNUC1025]|uniref:ABC transporter permease n=1 Tax=Spirosoma sp. KNUC1025 TaxID=2894082 RepID=UPI001E4068D2|nr:hypothetical protein [Spirosoma sp. KNUC1025]UFH57609.1 hypothetical protein LN737_30445 [Spirosoma sp. KNUC1025]